MVYDSLLRGLGCSPCSRIMLLWIISNWKKLYKKKTINRMLSQIFIFATNVQNILNEVIGYTIISISLNYPWNKMNAVQAESSRLWYFAITAVHAETWWKVANCCNRLQWVDCIFFWPAVRNIIGSGTVPYPRSDFKNLSVLVLFLKTLQL